MTQAGTIKTLSDSTPHSEPHLQVFPLQVALRTPTLRGRAGLMPPAIHLMPTPEPLADTRRQFQRGLLGHIIPGPERPQVRRAAGGWGPGRAYTLDVRVRER